MSLFGVNRIFPLIWKCFNFDFKYMGEQEDYYKKWFCLYEIYIFLSQFFGGLYSDFNFCCTHLENSS